MTAIAEPRSYRLTRPDGLGFFRRRSATQFVLGCVAAGLALSGVLVTSLAVAGRVALGLVGVALFGLAAGRTPSGEDLVDVVGPTLRWCWRRARGHDRWAAALLPFQGPSLPPLFAGLSLAELVPTGDQGRAATTRPGFVVDRADGTLSVLLRVYGQSFVLADPNERELRVDAFGRALAALSRSESPIVRVSWSQFVAPALFDEHLRYLEATERSDPNPQMQDAYRELVDGARRTAVHSEVLVTLTGAIGNARAVREPQAQLRAAATRLLDEAELLTANLEDAGLFVSAVLPVGSVARVIRERLDPSVRERLSKRGRTLADALGFVTVSNGFPLAIAEAPRAVRVDDAWHRLLRVAEWPRSAVTADWLASFLAERAVTRSLTVAFAPQHRRDAKRQALSVATRVGASIEEREQKGRRVGAEERRAQLAAEAIDEELEAGAEMELVLGLVDVCASSEDELAAATESTLSAAAEAGIELRTVELRQAEALLASLPVGRCVLGRAR